MFYRSLSFELPSNQPLHPGSPPTSDSRHGNPIIHRPLAYESIKVVWASQKLQESSTGEQLGRANRYRLAYWCGRSRGAREQRLKSESSAQQRRQLVAKALRAGGVAFATRYLKSAGHSPGALPAWKLSSFRACNSAGSSGTQKPVKWAVPQHRKPTRQKAVEEF